MSGRTAFEELKMIQYMSPLLEFGENVLARRSGVPDNRLNSAWVSGLWLGRSTETNEHIVGATSGIVRARRVKQKPGSEQVGHDRLRDDGLHALVTEGR